MKEIQSCIALRGRNAPAIERGRFIRFIARVSGVSSSRQWRKEASRPTRIGNPWELTLLLIRVKEEKQFVFDDRTADVAAELVALVFWLDGRGHGSSALQCGKKSKRVDGSKVAAPEKPKRFAVEAVRSGLGHSVGHAASRAAVFRRIVRGVDLKFPDGGLADRITDSRPAFFLREESLVIVSAVHRVVIQQSRDAAEADQSECSVRNGAGGGEREGRPSAPIHRQIIESLVIDIC